MLVQLGWLLGSRGQAEYLVAVFRRRLVVFRLFITNAKGTSSARIALLSARCRVCTWVKAWAAAKATIPLGLSFSGVCRKRRHSCRRKASFWASDIVTVPCPRANLYLGRELEGSGVTPESSSGIRHDTRSNSQRASRPPSCGYPGTRDMSGHHWRPRQEPSSPLKATNSPSWSARVVAA